MYLEQLYGSRFVSADGMDTLQVEIKPKKLLKTYTRGNVKNVYNIICIFMIFELFKPSHKDLKPWVRMSSENTVK